MKTRVELNDEEKVCITNNRNDDVCVITFLIGEDGTEEYNMAIKDKSEVF